MGNTHASSRKRPAIIISQDEMMEPPRPGGPPAKRPRYEEMATSRSGRSSTTNTMTSEDSSPASRKGSKHRKIPLLSRFMSLSSGKINGEFLEHHIPPSGRSTHSLGARTDPSSSSSQEGAFQRGMAQTVSLTSLSHRRDFPTPWLEALFLPSFPTRTGRTLSEKSFTYYEEIGRGAFGIVRRAQLRNHDRRLCAIKIQEKASVLARVYADRAKEEVEILKRLPSHPFVVHLYAAWQSRSRLYSCFEYPQEGCKDLFTVWRANGCILIEPAVRIIAAEVASALHFLHSNDVIFRDLKMENVLVDGDGHVRLADFGMAKTLRLGDRTSTICGTLQYMAPEVSSCPPEGYTHAVDWWTLGVLTHALLTANYPYPIAGATHHSQLVYVDYSTPPGRGPEISSFLDMMLHRRPERRLSTFAEIAAHPFFTTLNWTSVLEKKYSLTPHMERCGRIARRRKRIDDAMKHEQTDDDVDIEDFEGFEEKYEFHDVAMEAQ